MRTPWVPRLVIDEGDRSYDWKGALDVEVEEIGRLCGEPQMTKADVVFNAIAGPPKILRAALFILKRRAGEPVVFESMSIDTEVTVAYGTDESGREVDIRTEPVPCAYHRDGHVGLQPDCAKCGQEGPAVDGSGQIVWYYTDSGEPVPTRRGRSVTAQPTSLTSSGSVSGSASGPPPTGL